MSDYTVRQAKYPDEVWRVPIDWTAILEGSSIVGTPTAVPIGVNVDAIIQLGNITVVTVSGGQNAFDTTPKIELLATTSLGEKLGFNLGITLRPR
jgi:hypothetical protein